MNLITHNPEFSTGCSITELLSRVTTLASQLDSARKRIVALTSENTDHIKQKTEMREQFAKEKTALLQRIEELERSAALDSTNSCKPPSSDGLRKPNGKKDKNKKADKDKKKRTNSLREKSGRKSGGQPGHKGRTLKQVDEPDEIIDIFPKECPKCQTEFSRDDSIDHVRRQTFDIPPPPPPVVTDLYRPSKLQCCGKIYRSLDETT